MGEKQPVDKKSFENKGEKKPNPSSNVKQMEQPVHCCAQGCKTKEARFGFCGEHYEQFKFGLIKKTGEKVSDYDKKFDQYAAHKERSEQVRKVA